MRLDDSPVDGVIQLSAEKGTNTEVAFLNATRVVRVQLLSINEGGPHHVVRIFTSEIRMRRDGDGAESVQYSLRFEDSDSAKNAADKIVAEVRAAK